MSIHNKLLYIQCDLKVEKNRLNKFGGYNYRSAEDILEALKPLCSKHGVSVHVTENLIHCEGFPAIESEAIIFDLDGGSLSSKAVAGIDLQAKGVQMPQRFGAASSYAKKYALGNLFLIDDTPDADATNDHKKDDRFIIKKPKETIDDYKQMIDSAPDLEALDLACQGFSIDDPQTRKEMGAYYRMKKAKLASGVAQ